MSGWQLSGIHHLGLSVSDLEQSVAFYRDMLGLTVVGRRPDVEEDYIARQTGYPGVRLNAASLRVTPDSPQSLEIVEYLNCRGEPAETDTNRPGNSHLCLAVNDLMAAYAELTARGVKFRSAPVEITAGPNVGGKVVYLYDLDGYVVELFEPARRE